ncbi:hypothetical protein V6N11_020600 [Hibiscus sabdariffa]|uniref:RNase H type-1 domain-containing protein n=1 Tax=Hibiscus sabdariffa TaxID=183260 RepID=A0ABR2Q996_9ROSI
MERLGYMIHNAVDNGSWAPFQFIRNGTPLSYLFFADDLILYAKGDLNQTEVIESILTEFGSYSGHQVNCRKSSIYFSPNTNDGLKQAISSRMGFQQAACLVGNGWSVDLFRDVWIPSLGPLQCYLRDPSIVSRGLTFDSLVAADDNWDVPALSNLFSDSTTAHILNIKCPSADDCVDQSSDLTNYLTFESSSSHLIIFWIAYQQQLMTNAKRCRRNLSSDSSCIACSSLLESTMHLWKMRNDILFHNPILSDTAFVDYGLAWVKYYTDYAEIGTMSSPMLQVETMEWNEPRLEWVCLNVDGTMSLPLSEGSIGGLFRNTDGAWIMGFARAIGRLDSLQVELWALLEGLNLAWDQVCAIHRLRQKSWTIIVSWIPRDANRHADALAKLVSPSDFSIHVYFDPPVVVDSLLKEDINS